MTTAITGYVKKLGEPRAETVQIELSDSDRDDQRRLACDLRDQQIKLLDEKKNSRAAFNARQKDLEAKEEAARQRASTGIDHVAVVVQDFLTSGNQVVSVQLDTQKPVAVRTATADELQEDLFGGSDDGGGKSH